jgi:peptidoglycan hydrolase-like protein with peptidoglycan-binding domain
MVRRIAVFSFLVMLVVSLNGCCTAVKKKASQLDECKTQVSGLESQISAKDEEISSLRDALAKSMQETEECASKSSLATEVKSRPNTKQIQTALSNAGYNPGPIDGKAGKQTIEAIKAFQIANGLEGDGKVGKKTWSLLKEYLYKKSK